MAQWPLKTLGGQVNCVAISGNGQIVIAGTEYYQGAVPSQLGTYAYDANGNELWKDVSAPQTGDNGIYWVTVSRDGKWAASGGGHHNILQPSGPGYVNAYDVNTGAKTVLLSGIPGVNAVAISGDGSRLVAGADAPYVFRRQGSTFGNPTPLRNQIAARESVVSVGISDDGTWVVYGTSGLKQADGTFLPGKVGAYSTKAGTPQSAGPFIWEADPDHYVKSVAMASDGSGFAVVTTNHANVTPKDFMCYAYFFSLSAGANYFPTTANPRWPAWTLTGCSGTLSVAISAAGTRVAAVGNVDAGGPTSGRVFFFDAEHNNQLWMASTTRGPNCVSMDAAGKLVAVADGFLSAGGGFYLFDANGTAMPLKQPADVSWSIQASSDGTAITAGDDASNVFYFAMRAPSAPTNLRIG